MLLQILTLLGSLAMFLYGMSLMSGGLQKMAGNRLRSIMAKMTSNYFTCILTGIVVTAMVQSSTATTLLIVSFVNAGLLALGSAIAVIMGANIGTTVTAWIFALSFGGGSWSISAIAIPLMFVAFVCMNVNKKYANLGEFIMGFGLLFLGLSILKETSSQLLDNDGVRTFLASLSGLGIWSIFLFMLAGAIITLMLQSSATATAITMVLVAQGYIPFTMATAMVLGSNLGTTVTSNIAATVANVSAKRTARAHFLFNLFGVILTLIFFKPFIRMVGIAVEALGFPNPVSVDFAAADAATKESLIASLPYSVAVLHSVFNIITTLILVGFIPQLVKMVTWMVPAKGEEKESHRLKYIGAGNIATGDLALNSAKMEVVEFGSLCRRDLGYIRTAVNAKTREDFVEADKKLVHYEEITDNIEREIAVYLREVSKHELSEGGMARIRELYRIIGEMESLGDSGETIGKILSRVWEHDCQFTEDMLKQLNEMIDLVDQAYEAMDHNLATPLIELTDIRNAEDAEKAINTCRDRLRTWHLADIEKSSYPYETGSFYMDLINCLEKMGDFIINISQSVIEAKVV